MFNKQQSILEGLHNNTIKQFGMLYESKKKSVKEDTTLDFHEAESIKSFLDATGIISIPDVDSIVEFENEFNDYFGTPFDELSQQEQDLVLSNVEEILGVDDSNDADVEESVVSDTVDSAIKDETTEMNSLDDIPVEEIDNTENITADDIEKEDNKDTTSNIQDPENVVEAAVDEDRWVTMQHTHVLVDDNGGIKDKKLDKAIKGDK